MKHPRIPSVLAALVALVLAGGLIAGCSDDGDSLSERVERGLSVQAERGSGTLDIKRTTPQGTQPADVEKDTWTVFVYLCGSDLETDDGAATTDLSEMVGASGSEQVSFVVETGGAKKWQGGNVNSKELQRFHIQDGSIMEVDTVDASNMGDAETLADFLRWGLQNYPADHMGLILWDHGGGSVGGVCFDERNDFDSLGLVELDTAFVKVNDALWQKFDFVGFDACLMSTLETANVVASYANYMVASEESEPGTGWEYSSIMEYLAKNPSADGAQLGKSLCDSYLASLDGSDKKSATLSVVDLSKIDELSQSFYLFSQEMYSSGGDQETLAAMSRGIKNADNYGGNNWLEGYSNMVDMGGLVDACSDVTPSAPDVKKSLEEAVTYQVRGSHHENASGLSLYYPLSINDAEELATFEQVAPNPSYLSYVDRLAHGATEGSESYEEYSDDTWFEGDFWEWLFSEDETTEQQQEEAEQESEEYWSFVDEHSDSSDLIDFDEEPQIDEDGYYSFVFGENGLYNASDVNGLVYMLSEDGADWIALGETVDVYGDWDTGEFVDGFEGQWLSLPDGQNLCLYIAQIDDNSVLFTSPILLNGEETYLRIRQYFETGKTEVEGTWSGTSDNGSVDRGTTPLEKGDKIVPLYDSFSTDSGEQEEGSYEGERYKVGKKGLKVSYDELPVGTYQYSFRIDDVFGDSMTTDPVEFEIDKKGNIYYAE